MSLRKISLDDKMVSVKKANAESAKKRYEDNTWTINRNRILTKIDKIPNFRPKQSTLIKYKIEIPPQETTLKRHTNELEAKAQAKYGTMKLKELKRLEADRIANEAPRGVPPPDLTGMTQQEIEDSRKDLIVTPDEVFAGFQRLVDNKKLKAKTVKEYKKKFIQIVEWLNGNSQSNVIELLKNPEEVKTKIIAGMKAKGLSVESSLKDYFTPLMTLCKAGRDYLPAYCLGVDTEAYGKLMGGEITKKQLENIRKTQTAYVVPFKKIEKALTTISKGNTKNSIDHLIVQLYNEVPWRDDVGKLKIWRKGGTPPKEGNWYSPTENKIYLRDYKTERKYGPKEYKMTAEVKKIFEARDEKQKQNYLIEKPDGSLYNKGKISSMVPKAFKKAGANEKITINTIRHSAVSNLYNKSSATNEQKIQLADKMNHDTLTAYTVYTRPEFDDDKETVKQTRVAKMFEGNKLYFGYAGEKKYGYYPVVYSDGDAEDYTEAELKKGISLAKKNKDKDKEKT